MEARFSACNMSKLASCGKFDFSRPALDGNKLAGYLLIAKSESVKGRTVLETVLQLGSDEDFCI